MLAWSRFAPGRSAVFFAIAAVIAFAAVACGGDDDDEPAGDASPAPAAAAFPVTIQHKYGSTTITRAPGRVVSVGYRDQDFILAFGRTPLGVRQWFGSDADQVWPWAEDELAASTPREAPKTVAAAEIDLEAVAALKPDLILGISSGMTKEEYDLLAKIAPTLPQSGDYADFQMPWREEVRMAGRAFGQPEQAEEIIREIEGLYAKVKSEHPEFIGKTAAVASYYDGLPIGYSSNDGTSRLLQEIGFVIPKEFDELAAGAYWFSVSPEKMSVLDTDVIVWLAADESGFQTIRDLPLRRQMRAFREGREIFPDELVVAALSFSTPLSLDYLMERLPSMLAAAVDGNPSTPVN